MQTITISGRTFALPYADLLPPLTDDEYTALHDDIADRGVIVPVILDDQGNVLDGQHRLKIAAELGITDVPMEIRPGLSDEAKEALAFDLNAHRRHMSAETRIEISGRLRQRGLSYPQIADRLGISVGTAHADVATFQNRKVADMPAEITGKDGKTRPASMPRVRVDDVEQSGKALDILGHIAALPPQSVDLKDLQRAASVQKREERDQQLVARPWPKGVYRVIYADPPWSYSNSGFEQSAANVYPTMPTEAICDLPVYDMADDDSVLFLWATSPLLPDALEVIRAWGATYKASIIWDKGRAPGMGWFVQTQHEFLLIATWDGNAHPAIKPASVVRAEIGRHSEKPAAFYDLIESMYTGPYVELFARQAREGWAVWGNQV